MRVGTMRAIGQLRRTFVSGLRCIEFRITLVTVVNLAIDMRMEIRLRGQHSIAGVLIMDNVLPPPLPPPIPPALLGRLKPCLTAGEASK